MKTIAKTGERYELKSKHKFRYFIIILCGFLVFNAIVEPIKHLFANTIDEKAEISLGISGLKAFSETEDGSLLYIGHDDEAIGWKVVNKNVHKDDTEAIALSVSYEYDGEDRGETFFENVLSLEERNHVLELQAVAENDNMWEFGMLFSKNAILFTMPAEMNADEFIKVGVSSDLNKKAAILAVNDHVNAVREDNHNFYSGEMNVLSFSHASAQSIYESANRLSALILNENNEVLYYGKVNEADALTTTLTLPDLKPGEYSLLVFAEKENEAYISNYVSAFSELSFTINPSVSGNHDETEEISYLDELCSDENCSHVYRDLDGELFSLCARGEYMLRQKSMMAINDATDTNLALNKTVIARSAFTDEQSDVYVQQALTYAVDGDTSLNRYSDFGDMNTTKKMSVYLQVDLEEISAVNQIKLFRYYGDGRTYDATVIAIANSEDDFKNGNAVIVYNSDSGNVHGFGEEAYAIGKENFDERYSETSNGLSIDCTDIKGRYVRVYGYGSDANASGRNHIVELEVYGHADDPYYNEGIYFTSISDLYNDSMLYQDHSDYNGMDVVQVDAIFTNTAGSKKQYRMVELQNGMFSTVVPPKPNNEDPYKYLTFRIYEKDAEGNINPHDLGIIYDFTASNDQDDQILDENNGSFSLVSKLRDCYYWTGSLHTSYWSGHPSSDEKILDEQAIYVDKNGIDSWEKVWITYTTVNESGDRIAVSEEVTKMTRTDDIIYYLFDNNCGVTEHTLLAISNQPLAAEGNMIENNGAEIFYFLYNISSDDNMIILRNLDNYERIWGTYLAEGERYLAFRDQLYGQEGALIQENDQLQYRIGNSSDSMEDVWENMIQNTDPDSNADLYKLFFTVDKIPEEVHYIQFRIMNENGLKYQSDVLEIDDAYAYPCFFADVYQKSNSSYQSAEGHISGAWTSIFGTNYHGEESVNVPLQTNTTYDSDHFYASATIYDYYSEYELQGKDITTSNGTITSTENIEGGSTYDYPDTGSIFNTAISDYFKDFENVYPFYFGQNRKTALNSDGYNKDVNGNNDPYQLGYNDWTSGFQYSFGYVDKTLSEDGELTTQGVAYPQFDESFIRGDNSLKTSLGYVYNDVEFPFFFNDETGYWEYNSSDENHALRLKEDPKTGYYLDHTQEGVRVNDEYSFNGQGCGFFPFNDPVEQDVHLNLLYGMKMDIEFYITEDGTIMIRDDQGSLVSQDIIFKFSGDDDFMAYIDGHLALDIAGIHNPLYGEINFNSGNILTHPLNEDFTPNETQTHMQTNLYEIESDGQRLFTKENLSEGTHTMTIFFMERGMGISNLMISFNFPRSNQLDVTNEVDMSAANPFFEEALENIGNFKYTIYQQATSGDILNVEDSAGYLHNDSVVAFNDFTNINYQKEDEVILQPSSDELINGSLDNVLKLENIPSGENLSRADMQEKIISDNQYWVDIPSQDGNAVDLSGTEYLRINMYYAYDRAFSTGNDIHIRLVDDYGNLIQSTVNRLAYGNFTTSVVHNEWVTLRLDLKKLAGSVTNFDFSKVKLLQIAFARDGGVLYLNSLDFRGTIIEEESYGFNVSNNQISDYGSLVDEDVINYNKASLQPAYGAFFYVNDIGEEDVKNGNPVMVYENGEFELGDNWKASFVDKFREGSYLQIIQSNGSKLNSAFRTNWSILQDAVYDTHSESYTSGYVDDNWLALYPGQHSIINDPDIQDNTITHVEGYVPSDDRNVASVDEHGAISYIYPSSNRDNHTSGNNDTFVFRGYYNPDNAQKGNVHLTVAFENELITGGIVITKTINYDDERVADEDHTYTFHIHYENIAGMDLESGISDLYEDSSLTQTVSITVPKHVYEEGIEQVSLAIYGIPVGTEYTVHEVNEEPEILEAGKVYEYVKPDNSDFIDDWNESEHTEINTDDHGVISTTQDYNVGNAVVKQKVLKGTVKESIQELRFTNYQYYPSTEIQIVKELQKSVYKEDKLFLFHVHATWEENGETVTQLITPYVEVKAGQTSGKIVISELPEGASYVIHEVDESSLVSVTKQDYCTTIGTDEPLNDVESITQSHENVEIKENYEIETCGTVRYAATGITNISRQTFTFTNKGPNHLTVLKTDTGSNPLANAGFTLYDENGKVVESQKMSEYYRRNLTNTNDLQISIDGSIYSVYEAGNEKVYYTPLTDEEISAYLSGTLEDSEEVVALVHFDDLADGRYYLRETLSPNGYSGIDRNTRIQFTLPYDSSDGWTSSSIDGVNCDTSDGVLNVQYTIKNKMNTGIFQFYKENKEGKRMQGVSFALYRLNCNDDSHDHESDLIKIDENGELATDYPYSNCWYQIAIADTNQNGFLSFNGLSPSNTYRLIEVKTDDGYSLPKGQWIITYDAIRQNFTVSESINQPPAFSGQGTAADPYIVKNYKIGDLPSTGGRGWLYLLGAGLMLFVMIYWSYIGILRWKHKKACK